MVTIHWLVHLTVADGGCTTAFGNVDCFITALVAYSLIYVPVGVAGIGAIMMVRHKLRAPLPLVGCVLALPIAFLSLDASVAVLNVVLGDGGGGLWGPTLGAVVSETFLILALFAAARVLQKHA